jgi:outer membrane protein assembly factor BamB
MWRRLFPVAVALFLVLAAGGSASVGQSGAKVGGDWTRFGYDAPRHNAGPAKTGITPANVGKLRRQRVTLDGTVDASPIYLRGVKIHGASHDAFFVTTSYGRTIAVDAANGAILWRFTPSSYPSLAGSYRITNSTPVADPNRKFIYAASPDGRVHKLSVAGGTEARGWPVRVTLFAQREKLGTSLNFSRGLVLIGTGGYLGDAPPYQGHVVAISAATGRIVHVWNSLCSNVHRLLNPPKCAHSDSAIWARSGVVVVPGSGRLLVATGNGAFDGRHNWGDSALMLTSNASGLLHNWTPRNQASLESGDVDLGSTAPALIGGYAVQGGKDGKLRLLNLSHLGGRLGATGGELQTVTAPGGAGVFTTPAVSGKRLFVATDSGLDCYVLSGGRLHLSWHRSQGGTSPVVAGGLLYVYNGTLNVYAPTTGRLLASFNTGDSAHWSSPIVTDGRVAVPEGDANDHRTTGVLDIFRLP